MTDQIAHTCVSHLADAVCRMVRGRLMVGVIVRKATAGWSCFVCRDKAVWMVVG